MSKWHINLRVYLLTAVIGLVVTLLVAEFYATAAQLAHIDTAMTDALLALLIVNVWRKA